MADTIVVINPNSLEDCTAGIDAACAPLRIPGGPAIECVTLKEGPPGIQTQAEADSVIGPLCALIRGRDNDAAAFVIACYGDPGLHAAREATRRRVLGIAECGTMTALTLGERFGVIAIMQTSVNRQRRAIRAMGVGERFAGNVAIGLPVAELSDEGKTLGRMVEAGRTLRDAHGADVVIMGCGGMARYRDRLEDALGVPVVEPTQAAVTMAIGAVRLARV